MEEDRSRRLLWHGMLLFLLGLLTGLLVPQLINPRMGVSAHLEGVLNGIFLIVLGLVWARLRLSARQLGATFCLALYGCYVSWGATLFAAIFGTHSLTPVAAGSHVGAPWQEGLVTVALISVAIAMVSVSILMILGLGGARSAASEARDAIANRSPSAGR